MAKKLSLIGDIAPRDEWDEFLGTDSTVSAAMVREFLNENASETEIEIEISSNGGLVSEGLEIFDLLRTSGKKIKTIGFRVNSIASVVFLAGSERVLSENAQFLIHNAWISGEYFFGESLNAEELEKYAASCREGDEKILNAYCSVLGDEKREELASLMSEDSFLSNDQALELGFATSILEASNEPTLAKRKPFALNEYTFNKLKTEKMSKPDEKAGFMERIENSLNELFKKFEPKAQTTPEPETETPEEETEEPTAEEQLQAANARVSELENQLQEATTNAETLQAQNEELTNSLNEVQTTAEGLRNEFEEFKKTIPGKQEDEGKEKKNKLSEEAFNKLSFAEKIAYNAKNQL